MQVTPLPLPQDDTSRHIRDCIRSLPVSIDRLIFFFFFKLTFSKQKKRMRRYARHWIGFGKTDFDFSLAFHRWTAGWKVSTVHGLSVSNGLWNTRRFLYLRVESYSKPNVFLLPLSLIRSNRMDSSNWMSVWYKNFFIGKKEEGNVKVTTSVV